MRFVLVIEVISLINWLWFIQNLVNCVSTIYEKEIEPLYWMKVSQQELRDRLGRKALRVGNVAENAIIMIGDGMGITTVTAGRIYMGQRLIKNGQNVDGESYKTAMEQMPNLGLARTYSIDYQTTDSAASATAYLCGIKSRSGTIGVDGRCLRSQCSSCTEESYVNSVLKRAHMSGKWTGIVTNTRVTHASPAGAYAHIPERYWESFDGISFNQSHFDQGCRDIADQLVNNGSFLNVVFGGGLSNFLPNDNSSKYGNGSRVDSVDLIEKWLFLHRKKSKRRSTTKYAFINNLEDFNKLKPPINHVLGLFAPSHMNFADENANAQPSLASMTQKAIEILSKSPKGYVLFVEGGLIDVAHHHAQTGRALDEFVNFDEAVERVVNLVDTSKTMIVVSADHSHVFSIGANSFRNSDILGYASNSLMNASDVDNKPIFILEYGNGPGYVKTNTRLNENHWLEWKRSRSSINKSKRLKYPSALPLKTETHGGEDVPVYSDGPGSYLLSGTFEHNLIANAVAHSLCISPYDKEIHCEDD
ncbi:hypothetical protein GJ496_003154 [Pomphorhynchus laevis]|nr:hypothetical protein GJ496_003154 [Pomphorhynchus laevis]